MVQGSCSLCHETSLQMSTTNRKLNSYELSSLTNFECSLRFHAHLWAVFEKNAQLCGQEKHTEPFLVFNSRRSKRDLSAQKWLTCNFSKWYPYIIQQRGNSILGSLPFLWYKKKQIFQKKRQGVWKPLNVISLLHYRLTWWILSGECSMRRVTLSREMKWSWGPILSTLRICQTLLKQLAKGN